MLCVFTALHTKAMHVLLFMYFWYMVASYNNFLLDFSESPSIGPGDQSDHGMFSPFPTVRRFMIFLEDCVPLTSLMYRVLSLPRRGTSLCFFV